MDDIKNTTFKVKSASIKLCIEDGIPEKGFKKGDEYLELITYGNNNENIIINIKTSDITNFSYEDKKKLRLEINEKYSYIKYRIYHDETLPEELRNLVFFLDGTLSYFSDMKYFDVKNVIYRFYTEGKFDYAKPYLTAENCKHIITDGLKDIEEKNKQLMNSNYSNYLDIFN